MPKYDQLYKRKKPLLQIKILKSVALSGRLSQKEAVVEFQCKPSTISDAFKTMKNRNIIETTKHPDNLSELEERLKREKFYKLSAEGLLRFIKENPSPYEFWIAMIWYGFLNFKSGVNRDEFSKYYNPFIRGYIGEYNLRSCFFLGNLFENLFQGWRKELEHKCELVIPEGLFSQMQDMFPHNFDCIMQDRRREETEKAYKILECLLLNRGITINKIIELTRLKEQEVIKIIEKYSMTQTRYSQYIDDYELGYQSYNRSEGITIDLLNHLLIVPVKNKNEKEKNNEKYELSLLGVLLELAIISLQRRNKDNMNFNYYKSNYYNIAASNYREKLPLIFEKWGLLKKILDYRLYEYTSIFDYLFLDKAEILSLSVSLGGNKEIYDNIKAATMNAINKFSIVYDDWLRTIEAFHYDEGIQKSEYYRLIQEKINEMKISLSFTSLTSFGKYMKEKKESAHISPTFEDDLHHIENALSDEFSFLFYVGLLRENNHVASDFPFTTELTRPNPRFAYDKYFLDSIVAADDEIRNKLNEWIKASKTYQEQALKKMDLI
jgi:DNA-binding MarR family transcriptional regulator